MTAHTHLIYYSKADALAGNAIIWRFGVELAQAGAYTASVESGIVGKRDGVDDPDGARTLYWDKPPLPEILGARWIVSHPNRHTLAKNPALMAQLMGLLGHPEEGSDDGSWYEEEIEP